MTEKASVTIGAGTQIRSHANERHDLAIQRMSDRGNFSSWRLKCEFPRLPNKVLAERMVRLAAHADEARLLVDPARRH
jgi:hypothetical protein